MTSFNLGQIIMPTLVYKQTHLGDPQESDGIFGSGICMGQIRGYNFDAVIGIGGHSEGAKACGIDGKITWIATGAQKSAFASDAYPTVVFNHFLYFGKNGPLLYEKAPYLARKMLKARFALKFDPEQELEIEKLLAIAKDAPASRVSTQMSDQ